MTIKINETKLKEIKRRKHESAGNYNNIYKEETNKGFRLNRKHLFLTYSQTDITPEECYQQLAFKLGKWVIDDHVIVQEKHKVEIQRDHEVEIQRDHEVEEKPGTHLHCYIALSRRCDIKNQEFLHLTNEKGLIAKGNYQGAKDQNAIIQYVLKHIDLEKDNHLVVMSKGIESRISKIKGFEEDVNVSAIRLAREGQIEDAMMLMEKHFPKEFLRNHVKLEKSFRTLWLNNVGFQNKFNFNQFEVPRDLQDFLNLQEASRFEKTMIIIGESNLGKTQLVRAWLESINKKFMYVTHLEGLKELNETHKFIVFDDCEGLRRISREQAITLIDTENPSDIRILHGCQRINPKVGRVIIANNKNRIFQDGLWNDPAIARRVSCFEIKEGTQLKHLQPRDPSGSQPRDPSGSQPRDPSGSQPRDPSGSQP
jgi:hypothetical protein